MGLLGAKSELSFYDYTVFFLRSPTAVRVLSLVYGSGKVTLKSIVPGVGGAGLPAFLAQAQDVAAGEKPHRQVCNNYHGPKSTSPSHSVVLSDADNPPLMALLPDGTLFSRKDAKGVRCWCHRVRSMPIGRRGGS